MTGRPGERERPLDALAPLRNVREPFSAQLPPPIGSRGQYRSHPMPWPE